MPLPVTQGVPTLFFRRASYERAGLTRAALDSRLGLTDAEFRVEDDIVALGPIYVSVPWVRSSTSSKQVDSNTTRTSSS